MLVAPSKGGNYTYTVKPKEDSFWLMDPAGTNCATGTKIMPMTDQEACAAGGAANDTKPVAMDHAMHAMSASTMADANASLANGSSSGSSTAGAPASAAAPAPAATPAPAPASAHMALAPVALAAAAVAAQLLL